MNAHLARDSPITERHVFQCCPISDSAPQVDASWDVLEVRCFGPRPVFSSPLCCGLDLSEFHHAAAPLTLPLKYCLLQMQDSCHDCARQRERECTSNSTSTASHRLHRVLRKWLAMTPSACNAQQLSCARVTPRTSKPNMCGNNELNDSSGTVPPKCHGATCIQRDFSSHRDASSLYLKLAPSARLVMLKLHIWSVPLCHAHSCDLAQSETTFG